MNTPIRIGVIGGNFASSVHVPAFKSDPRCQINGIVASSAERSEKLATEHRLPKIYGHWKEIIDDKEIDAVTIAVPPSLQPDIAIAAFANGKAVFGEKPLAATLEQAQKMHQAALNASTAHLVNFNLAALAPWIKVKEIIDTGGIGRLSHIVVQYISETPPNLLINSWRANKGQGSGTLYDILSHFFHALEWYAGPVNRLSASLFSTLKNNPNGDTFDIIGLEFASGIPASITVSRTTLFGMGYRIEFSGEEGTLILACSTKDIRGFQLFLGTRKSKQLELISALEKPNENPLQSRIEAVSILATRFLDWIETGIPEVPSFEEGLRVQRLLDAAYRSNEQAKWVTV